MYVVTLPNENGIQCDSSLNVKVTAFMCNGAKVVKEVFTFTSMTTLLEFIDSIFVSTVSMAYDLTKKVLRKDILFHDFVNHRTMVYVVKNKRKLIGMSALESAFSEDDILQNRFLWSVYIPVTKQTIGMVVDVNPNTAKT